MLKHLARTTRVAALFVAAGLAPASLWGHAVVLESSVPHDARLSHTPEVITVRLNGKIEHALTRVTIERLNGASATPLESAATGPDRIAIRLPPLPEGSYVIRYRVLAADGHVTEGALRFHVSDGAAAR